MGPEQSIDPSRHRAVPKLTAQVNDAESEARGSAALLESSANLLHNLMFTNMVTPYSQNSFLYASNILQIAATYVVAHMAVYRNRFQRLFWLHARVAHIGRFHNYHVSRYYIITMQRMMIIRIMTTVNNYTYIQILGMLDP